MQSKRFRTALSFPGERRDFVAKVATALAKKIGRDHVFYDRWYEAELARPNLDTYLMSIYHDHSELLDVFLCEAYERKEWPGLEWRAIRDLIKQRKSDTIMLFRFDDAAIPGIFSIDGYISVDKRSPEEVADLILTRLNQGAAKPSQAPCHHRMLSMALFLIQESGCFWMAITSKPSRSERTRKGTFRQALFWVREYERSSPDPLSYSFRFKAPAAKPVQPDRVIRRDVN